MGRYENEKELISEPLVCVCGWEGLEINAAVVLIDGDAKLADFESLFFFFFPWHLAAVGEESLQWCWRSVQIPGPRRGYFLLSGMQGAFKKKTKNTCKAAFVRARTFSEENHYLH